MQRLYKNDRKGSGDVQSHGSFVSGNNFQVLRGERVKTYKEFNRHWLRLLLSAGSANNSALVLVISYPSAMTVTQIRVPIYFITGLLLTSSISLIIPTHAAPNSLRSPRQMTSFPAVPKELENKSEITNKRIEENSFRKSDKNIKLKENELRIIESVVGIGVNKIINIMTAVGNVLNARSNIDSVDRYMTTFNSLFSSRGGGSVYAYYYIIANFWVVFDAAVMIFRSWENRFSERKANVEALQAQQDTNSAVEETLAALSEANAQLVLLKDGLNNLIRRKDIRRKGRLVAFNKRSFEEKQIDKYYSGNESNDEKNNNSEEEEEEEEPTNEDVTEDANSSQEDIVPLSDSSEDGEDMNPNVSVNQEFDENAIPE